MSRYDEWLKEQRAKDMALYSSQAPSGFNQTYLDEEGSIYDEDLKNDKYFQQASEIIYNMNNSADAPRLSPEDYAKYGIETMGWFNWNIPKMTLDANRISGATEEQRKAFLYMMEAYDDLGVSWNGAKRFFKGVILDPTTYVGLSTFGLGTAASQGAKQASKAGLKELLKQSTKGGIIAGTEAGIYTAVDDINRQVVETSVSGEDIDLGRVAKSAVIGVGAGFTLGTGITAFTKKLQGKTTKEIAEEVSEEKQIDELAELPAVLDVNPDSTVGKVQNALARVVKAVKATAPAGKSVAVGEDNVQSMEGLVEAVEPIKEILVEASTESPDDLVRFLELQNLTDEQAQVLEVSTTQIVSVLKTRVYNLRQKQKSVGEDAVKAKSIKDQIDEVEDIIIPLDRLDVAMSTKTGRRLRARQAGKNTGKLRGETISTLEKSGLTRSEAEREWDAIFAEKLIKKEREDTLRTLDKNIETARKNGDMSEFFKLKHERKLAVDNFKEEVLKEEGSALYRAINKPIKVLNEVMISFVFSPATLIVNTVPSFAKTIYKPFLNNLMQDGLSATSRKKMVAEYSAMNSMWSSAFKMAKAAWRYEKSMLTGDSARFLEEYNTIPKKYGGHFLRFFPRALLFQDAFFENLHYRGYTVGKATGDAMEEFARLKANRPRKEQKYNSLGTRTKHPKAGIKGAALAKGDTYRNSNDLTKYAYDGKQWVTFDSFYQKRLNENFEKGSDWTTVRVKVDGKFKELDLDSFIELRTKDALDKAYAPEENAIEILMQDGISRGLSGKQLENFITKELDSNKEVFTKATDQEGRDYVQDILFKRDFSGKGAASTLARGYEQFVNRHPAMRLAGQLFFRTPVRVFEEGMRMTPGINLMSPKVLADLRGDNGTARQVKAQGEALMSYAIAGAVFSLYSTGNITGALGQGQNYKQTKQGENAGIEPYSIKFSDGSVFNYRNFDPFSTPIKIIVNALERAETLAYRQEQGENLDQSELDKLQSIVAVGTGSIMQSIRDANLASGIDAVADFFEDLAEPESADELIKFLGRKTQAFLPNTYYKYQMMQDPVLGDPVTFEHFIRQRINPADPLVPKQYTALGRPRTDANPQAKMYYFSTASVEDRKRGKSDKEFEVEQFLYKLAQVGDTHFTAPHKYKKYTGDLDLRTKLTSDGTESYYDRWMRYVLESNLIEVLYTIRNLPMGTASQVGIAEKSARKAINEFREAAFMRLYGEELGIRKNHQEIIQQMIRGRTGQSSSDNIMFNIGN